jgi:hypothetical protein
MTASTPMSSRIHNSELHSNGGIDLNFSRSSLSFLFQAQLLTTVAGGGEIDDGTILYIDPNDPQAAEILQQAGLRLAEDGTVQQAHMEGEEQTEDVGIDMNAVEQPADEELTKAEQQAFDVKPTNGQQQVFEDAMVRDYDPVKQNIYIFFQNILFFAIF